MRLWSGSAFTMSDVNVMAPNPKPSAFALVTVALVTSLPAASLGSGPPSSAFNSNVKLSESIQSRPSSSLFKPAVAVS